MSIILGIETSCDETAAAVVRSDKTILSNIVHSQMQEHLPYGGVVPEIAARSHLVYLEPVITQALTQANVTLEEIDAIAVTAGPGLIGGVMVGVMAAKAMAAVHEKPFIAINHLEGHALTARLTDDVPFPFILLLISGGHCQFILAKNLGHYEVLGQTIDDAVGESFDKIAQLLELDYPGGPEIEKLARQGDPNRFVLPKPLKGKPGCDLSFSGLKTAVRQLIENQTLQNPQDRADIAASFQQTIADTLGNRLQNCLDLHGTGVKDLVIAGGVAANQYLRQKLEAVATLYQKRLVVPPAKLCTDNAVMIAWAGAERLKAGYVSKLDFAPRPRWPLTEMNELESY
ncbi:tRNA (adenosine(37)-N6)-threonylcarbamoyltransferase complex transferase subunit TsaD [Candidatus Paracaedibacter symbiosus]|uniref:tRNA (adenosine(37)-N6)-threonylcarbamoyltransferase complex transferase subunit TsaD n=1 Tax=Candidatus Paracaedibacter symbiosus TaxID=244582 RepID=UPI0005098514|nr:tRNA (adenosine(37)-N6)-threonylcarbamoyltransferase complex transferase subunit TsaD [Candidatus Paracaedibacter symbiosus]